MGDKKALHYDAKYTELQTSIKRICLLIEDMFKQVGAIESDLPCGAGNGISETTMSAYLAVIERQSSEMLATWSALKEDEEDDAGKPPRVTGSSANLQIKLPSTVEDHSDDEEDEDEDDQRPFTRDELKLKTLRTINKKQKKSKA